MSDLLVYDDVAFVDAAYQATLGRRPDDDGLNCYLAMLRNGASKAEIIGRLCRSPEGRQRGTKVAGVALPYALDKVSRWPLIGRFVAIAFAIWNLPDTERRARRLANDNVRRITQLTQDFEQAVSGIDEALRTLERAVNLTLELSKSFASRAHLQALERTCKRTMDSVRSVEAALANKVDQGRLESSVREIYSKVDTKADCTALLSLSRQTQSTAQSKAGRKELEQLADSLDVAIKEMRSVAQSKADREELATLRLEFAGLQDAKANVADVHEAHQLLLRGMEAKVERHELTGFANHVMTLFQQRATADDLGAVAHSIEKINVAIATLEKEKADNVRMLELQADALSLEDEIKATLRDAIQATEGDLRRSIAPLASALDRLERSKIDQSQIDGFMAQTAGALKQITDHVDVGLNHMSAVKLDRDAFSAFLAKEKEDSNATTAKVTELIGSLTRSKVDVPTLEALRMDTAAAIREGLNTSLATVMESIQSVAASKADMGALEAIKAEGLQAIDGIDRRLKDALADALRPLNVRHQDLRRNVLDQERRIALLLDEARKRFPQTISRDQVASMMTEEDHRLDAMYATFEDQFRGTRGDIRNRLTIYLPYIRDARAGTLKSPVLDLGCGRGEWLELLRDEGLSAKGVDVNRVFLSTCRELDLSVIEHDALSYVRELRPGSVGAVTLFHVIEHVTHRCLVALVDEILRVLRPGGVLIMETPNPKNVLVGACNFYLDPTHRNPLPPDLPRYILEARGFAYVEVKEIHPFAAEDQISEGAPAVRETLNRFFFSAQDYAVIGRKA